MNVNKLMSICNDACFMINKVFFFLYMYCVGMELLFFFRAHVEVSRDNYVLVKIVLI